MRSLKAIYRGLTPRQKFGVQLYGLTVVLVLIVAALGTYGGNSVAVFAAVLAVAAAVLGWWGLMLLVWGRRYPGHAQEPTTGPDRRGSA
jgi:hypothetical protein